MDFIIIHRIEFDSLDDLIQFSLFLKKTIVAALLGENQVKGYLGDSRHRNLPCDDGLVH